MKIITNKYYPGGPFAWSAVYDNYDGAEDSSNRHHIGFGATEAEAIEDLERLEKEKNEWEEDEETANVIP